MVSSNTSLLRFCFLMPFLMANCESKERATGYERSSARRGLLHAVQAGKQARQIHAGRPVTDALTTTPPAPHPNPQRFVQLGCHASQRAVLY